jgi:hypothetical protein
VAETLALQDAEAVSDFRVFLERAAQSTDGVVRVTTGNSIARVTVCTFSPFGLLDTAPTVLGMRTFAEASSAKFDAVLGCRTLLDRIAHLEPGAKSLSLPPVRETATWVGVEPPQGEWARVGELPASTLNGSALAGIAEVAEALPENPGELVTREVRSLVWGAPLNTEFDVPRSVAFTAHMLGFLSRTDTVQIYESGRWRRASTPYGHALVYLR